MNNSNPFSRSRAIFSAITEALAISQHHFSMLKMAGMFEYKSRGHGGKHRAKSAKRQRILGASKYQPHQGKQEIARRFARMN